MISTLRDKLRADNWQEKTLIYIISSMTRSLGIRLRVKPFRLKNFFEDICCATLVRWAMPITPRRTNFYMTKREKNKVLGYTPSGLAV